jgi:predicted DNA-binding transcriptional regulator AlpA
MSNASATETIIPELMSLDQAAALCGVSPRTLWGWAKSGISPAPLKIGRGTVRYSRSAYVAWIAAGCKPCNGGRADG